MPPWTLPLPRLMMLPALAIARAASQRQATGGPPLRRCCCSTVGNPQPRPLLRSIPPSRSKPPRPLLHNSLEGSAG